MAERTLTAALLAERLAALADEPATLATAAAAAARFGRLDAAARLADLVADLLPHCGRNGAPPQERAA